MDMLCGQIKADHMCMRTWFHNGDHIAQGDLIVPGDGLSDGVRWGAEDSDDLGWTASYGITHPMTAEEFKRHMLEQLENMS